MTPPPATALGSHPAPTERRLADGRRIFYFDDEPGHPHLETDNRQLEPVDARSELRYDAVEDEWVIVAAHRQVRTHLPPSDECPLCPSTVSRPTEIPAHNYDVVVFDNRFPSLTPRRPAIDLELGTRADGEPSATGGRCEVMSFSDDHKASFATLSRRRLATIGRAMAHRTDHLGDEPGVEYVLCFENRGQETGVTLHHPHGQVYAYPFVPPRITRSLESARRHLQLQGRCLFCDLVERELTEASRIVASTDQFVSFVPGAPRWPFEVHTYPLRHVSNLSDLTNHELAELMVMQSKVVATLDNLFSRPMPYTAGWIQAPVHGDPTLNHLRTTIVSVKRTAEKLKYFAGSESLVGAFINDVVPEVAAKRLRSAWEHPGHA